ncbi:MAG: phosphatidylserine/phosphatidylglycerophosphate/cardiolipin synthase family protein [Gammaproteobacteria bacterium]|nr:phosphatidylserine/phosphatidylglycerophosphate/cardiolipin synthase family protein [Gammaproteobacteria bacterium]
MVILTISLGPWAAVAGDDQAPQRVAADDLGVPNDATPPAVTGVRRLAGVAQGGWLAAQTWYLDPLLRPVSNVKSLFSVAIKSLGGVMARQSINTFQFPLLAKQPIPPVTGKPGMDLSEWERYLDDAVGGQSSGQIELLVDGSEYFPRLLDAVAGARQSIDIRTYIFDNDDIGVAVADRLKARSGEVNVRVLLDGLGQLVATQVDPDGLPAAFTPPAFMASYLETDSRVSVRTQTNPWFTGDHSKTTIVDRTQAFVGGMNIGREYRYAWHDLMAAVTGPIVAKLQFEMDKAWSKASLFGDVALFATTLRGSFPKKARIARNANDYPIRILHTRDHDSQIYRTQLAAIRRAQSYIYIQNPYFSDDKILYELARARRRGVDVRVITASRGDFAIQNLSNRVTINAMLHNGISVYLYPGMSHVKAAIYDGWACLGSANLDKLSLQINQETNLATSHPPVVDALLQRVFWPDFAASRELREASPVEWTHLLAELLADEAL